MISRRQIIGSHQELNGGCQSADGKSSNRYQRRQEAKVKESRKKSTRSSVKPLGEDYELCFQDRLNMFEERFQDSNKLLEDAPSGGDGDNEQENTKELIEEHYKHFDPYSVYGEDDEEEDVWYSEERLFEDHIQEIIDKWTAIDDEIWAKIICMERNRRIAKAYARKHAITVNGSEDEYLDGTTLGLNSFENPDRDAKTERIKQYIGHGLRLRITQNGDILAKRLSKANVFVHQSNRAYRDRLRNSNSSSDLYAINSEPGDLYGVIGHSNNFISNHIGRQAPRVGKKLASSSDGSNSSSSGVASSANEHPHKLGSSVAIELNRAVKIFDMSKFKDALESESRRACPNRKRLQNQCISIISFVLDDSSLLNLPSWIMIVNMVAIDLLKNELGLTSAYDSFGSTDPLVDQRRFGICPPNCSAELPVSSSAAMFSLSRLEPEMAASKRAFANAAALGAYNGDHYAVTPPLSGRPHPKQIGRPLPKRLPHELAGQLEVQQLSSSSGFNSHCSSQNDSSAASSSSNLEGKMPERTTNAGSRSKEPISIEEEECSNCTGIPLCCKNPQPSLARGKKAPKLPYRMTPICKNKPSEPIEMPASFGSRANLILVSPTGLSPPLNRKTTGQDVSKEKLDRGELEFETIKRVDENGQCSILLPDQCQPTEAKLPAGIPPHAQLAPPSTQRHILRYLMSANRHKLFDTNRGQPGVPALPVRCQRPLPIVPMQQVASNWRSQQEDTLYYYGLQARVPFRRQPMQEMQAHLSPNGQINAIMTNLRQKVHLPLSCQDKHPRLKESKSKKKSLALSSPKQNDSIGKSNGDFLENPLNTSSVSSVDKLNHKPTAKSPSSLLGQVSQAVGRPLKLMKSKVKSQSTS